MTEERQYAGYLEEELALLRSKLAKQKADYEERLLDLVDDVDDLRKQNAVLLKDLTCAAEENELLRKEVNRCHARLEIDHYYSGVFEEFSNRVDIPLEERLDGGILKESDGVAIRDLQLQLREDDLDIVYMKGIRRGMKAYRHALTLREGDMLSSVFQTSGLSELLCRAIDEEVKKYD